MKKIDLVGPFRDYFKLVPAVTDELRKEVFRIRYSVYCDDLGWEDGSRFADRMEVDDYDRCSRHCVLLHRKTNLYVGCVRLVLAEPDTSRPAIPLQQHCKESLSPEKLDIASLSRESFGEISRLAIRKEFRRRVGEKKTPDGIGEQLFAMRQSERRRFPHIVLALYMGAASVGLGEGLDSVFAMMEPRLGRHLRLNGIKFRQVGDITDYHGPRAAFHITREELLNNLHPELRKLLEAIKDDLGV